MLIAHGSRRPEANADLVKLAEMVRERSDYSVVETSDLELTEPTIPQGVKRCIDQHAQEVLMLPYFLSAGAHVVEDLERFRQEAAEEYPEVECQLRPHLGLHLLMVELVMTRLSEGQTRKSE